MRKSLVSSLYNLYIHYIQRVSIQWKTTNNIKYHTCIMQIMQTFGNKQLNNLKRNSKYYQRQGSNTLTAQCMSKVIYFDVFSLYLIENMSSCSTLRRNHYSFQLNWSCGGSGHHNTATDPPTSPTRTPIQFACKGIQLSRKSCL